MLFLGLLLTIALVHAGPVVDEADQYARKHPNPYIDGKHPIYGGQWYQGDIRLPGDDPNSKEETSAIIGDWYKWPGNTVPYVISSAFQQWEVNVILNAMAEMEWNTGFCIRFVPRTWETDYVSVINNGGGCWSWIGRLGGMQQLSIDSFGCVWHGIVMHEFMHALGFYHEQSRGDRDWFVTIHWDNIMPGTESNFFAEVEGVTINHLGTPYDYESIMHYDAYAFAIDPSRPTITPHDPNAQIGNIDYMSFWDIDRVRRHYGCA